MVRHLPRALADRSIQLDVKIKRAREDAPATAPKMLRPTQFSWGLGGATATIPAGVCGKLTWVNESDGWDGGRWMGGRMGVGRSMRELAEQGTHPTHTRTYL